MILRRNYTLKYHKRKDDNMIIASSVGVMSPVIHENM